MLHMEDFEGLDLQDISLRKALFSQELKTVTFTVTFTVPIHTGPTADLWGSEARRSLAQKQPKWHRSHQDTWQMALRVGSFPIFPWRNPYHDSLSLVHHHISELTATQ